jgi:formylglycine-generating enzyme required for sulfatase activity
MQLDAGTADGGPASADGGDPGSSGSGSSGSDGAGSGGSGSGGTGSSGDCDLDSHRCTSAGRERCDGSDWVSAPCPLDEPACVSGSCELRGPTMVKVGSFYIDSTEVTVADYVEFLDARGDDTDGQPTVCSWNTSFYDGTPVDPDAYPITYVDWCDAAAYCDWAGKRLCGALEGGAVDPDQSLVETESQWFLACGGSGGASHPNDDPDCNSTGGGGGLDPVGTNAGCEGHYPGLFDMEGNVAEWVDSCATETGADDFCLLLGGNYIDSKSYCSESYDDNARNTTAGTFGFRCCSGG